MMSAKSFAYSAAAFVLAATGAEAGRRKSEPVEEATPFITNPYEKQDLMLLCGGAFAVLIIAIQMAPKQKILSNFLNELFGTILMVICTFAPGPVFGHLGIKVEWPLHMVGVIVADRTMGGPNVNPGVTFAMFVWGACNFAEATSRIAAQLVGAAIAFPTLQALVNPLGATIGGPSFDPATTSLKDAFAGEFAAFAFLMCAIFGFCTTPLGKRYFIKQPLVAATIRFAIYFYGAAGPAINPALGTMYAFYSTGSLPRDPSQYIVYWLAPAIAGTLITLLWSAGVMVGVVATKNAQKKSN